MNVLEWPEHLLQWQCGRCDVEIVVDCDHFYVKREHVIADVVTSWLAKQFPVNSQERA